MKKIFALMTAVFALSMVFTSCTKEGQYMPKKKISEVVHQKSYTTPLGTNISRTEREVWNWNGRLLSYIDYYSATGDRTTSLFRYDDDKRVEEINYGSYTAKFDYDDGLVDEIKILNDRGEVITKYDFEHEGKTVTAIDITTGGQKDAKPLPFNPLRLFLPENAANSVQNCAATKGSSRMVFTWTGKNITAMDIIGAQKVSYKWTYDDKVNPYKGLFDLVQSRADLIYSVNNVTREEKVDGSNVSVESYTYTYDGKCPVKKVWEMQENELFDITITIHCETEYRYQ